MGSGYHNHSRQTTTTGTQPVTPWQPPYPCPFLYISIYLITMKTNHNSNPDKIPEKRIVLNRHTGRWEDNPIKKRFLKGPIPLDWLTAATQLPGKAINVGIALWWIAGMSKTDVLKLTRQAQLALNISKDAERDGLRRLQQAGLIELTTRPGQRHSVRIIKDFALHGSSD